ncbi:hypothetical protein LG296_12955 [Ureibacillus chungkukjangi]|uniref:hypothetical protein n=1 Tax=Ureibacillus chungkukjangi TaxID=1202712 RepID=UPI00384F7D50
MTKLSYLGCNFKLPVSEIDSDDKVLITQDFPDEEDIENVKKHFSTKYVYEVFENDGSGIWFNQDYKREYSIRNLRSQEIFLRLCELLKPYLKEGDYCELYICWSGEEGENRNEKLDQTFILDNTDINDIEIYEKTLLIIRK